MNINKYPHKISIITINYNNLEGLRKTFESVFKQTETDFEYIVIDGNSNDGSKELIIENSKKINFWVSEKDKGIYNALNKGINSSNGEYILCLNSGDCLYDNEVIKNVKLELSGNEDIIYGNTFISNAAIPERAGLWLHPEKLSFDLFLKGSISHQSAFVKRDLYQKVGNYDENLKIVSDWKFFIISLAFFKASYRHINLIISDFDGSGISTLNVEINESERLSVLSDSFGFFLKEEITQLQVDPGSISKKIRQIVKYFTPYGLIKLTRLLRQKRSVK